MVGYGGQDGRYTDLETLDIDAGTYLQTFGPGKPTFYNPDGGIAMARNEAMYYEVQAEGIQIIGAMAMSSVGGLVGAAVGGAIWTYGCDRINGLSVKESAKDALIDGATNLAIAGVLHVAGQALSGETAELRKGATVAEFAEARSVDSFPGRCNFMPENGGKASRFKMDSDHYPNPDPPMTEPQVEYQPKSIEEVQRMRQGYSPKGRDYGPDGIEAHHRQQVPVSEGGKLDMITKRSHRLDGNHTRHNRPSKLSASQRKREIKQGYKDEGAKWLLPGEGI